MAARCRHVPSRWNDQGRRQTLDPVQRRRLGTPAITPALPGWQAGIGTLMHVLLYVFFVAMPLMGLATAWLDGKSVFLPFTDIALPAVLAPNPAPDELSRFACCFPATAGNATMGGGIILENCMAEQTLTPPPGGASITISGGKLSVPNNPIIPFIEGDGTGADIWRASVRVLDAAVAKAYGGSRKIHWLEVLAGEKANNELGTWLPESTVQACRDYLVSIKGPLTTPVGGGIRSLNVALRQMLDLYVCLRPVRWFKGVPSPVKAPEKVNMTIFRENTEDIYAGIEWAGGSPEAQKVLDFVQKEFPQMFGKIRFGTAEKNAEWQAALEGVGGPKRETPVMVGIGLKPVSYLGTERLVHSAIQYAIAHKSKSVTLVHKGNIMKFSEGGFRDWGYQVAKDFYAAVELDGGPWMVIPDGKPGAGLIIKDAIADAFLQQILLRPAEYDVVATLNLNGDYLSDALAAQVGGIGIAPGANINYVTGHAVFEATHGTAPKYAGLDKVNPGSVILSGEMMLRYMGWHEAADAIIRAMDAAIGSKRVTYDFARLMEGATEVKCSEFGDELIKHM